PDRRGRAAMPPATSFAENTEQVLGRAYSTKSQILLLVTDHLNVAWNLVSVPLSPSLYVRRTHTNSPPGRTLSRAQRSFAEAYSPLWKAVASWKLVLSTLVKL